LRVGYLAPNLPFAYFNGSGDLVGFDMEMAHVLARELGVALVFVPVTRANMSERLRRGNCDIVISGLPVTTDSAVEMAFSNSYMEQTMALIVKDHRRDEFRDRDAIKRLKAPRIGVLNIPWLRLMAACSLSASCRRGITVSFSFYQGRKGCRCAVGVFQVGASTRKIPSSSSISSAVRCQSAALALALICSGVVAPAMTLLTWGCARSQANASSTSGRERAAAKAWSCSSTSKFSPVRIV
jgi:hypothetical protein